MSAEPSRDSAGFSRESAEFAAEFSAVSAELRRAPQCAESSRQISPEIPQSTTESESLQSSQCPQMSPESVELPRLSAELSSVRNAACAAQLALAELPYCLQTRMVIATMSMAGWHMLPGGRVVFQNQSARV